MRYFDMVFKNKTLHWFIAIAWTIFLSILLLQPESQTIIPTGIQPAPPSLKREILFSTVHLVTMGFTAIIWCFALGIRKKDYPLIALVMMLVSYGLSVEYLQGFVAGRTAQWWDMLANIIGISLGIYAWISVMTITNFRKFVFTR